MEADGARAERNDDPARLDTPLPIRGFFKVQKEIIVVAHDAPGPSGVEVVVSVPVFEGLYDAPVMVKVPSGRIDNVP